MMIQRRSLAFVVVLSWVCLTDCGSVISSLYKLVKCCSDSVQDKSVHLLFKNRSRIVPDVESVKTLGFEYDTLQEISSHDMKSYRASSPVPLLKDLRGNPDQIIATELSKIRSLVPEPLFSDWTDICQGCKNPAVWPWQGQLLAISEVTRLKGDVLHVFWVNSSILPLFHPSPYLGISNEPQEVIQGVVIPGTDARIAVHAVHQPNSRHRKHRSHAHTGSDMKAHEAVMDNNLLVAYFPRFRYPWRIGYAELSINNSQAVWTELYDAIVPDTQDFPKEKNWAPFFWQPHNDTEPVLCFIQSVDPLHVVAVQQHEETPLGPDLPALKPPSETQLFAHTLSNDEPGRSRWDKGRYGSWRGGTNAIYLPPPYDRFLALFHAIGDLASGYKTYFLGAYAFSSSPPFRLLAHSAVPMVDDLLYGGPWYSFKANRYDYVPYAMTLSVLHANSSKGTPGSAVYDVDKDTVLLSLGLNDNRGLLCKLRLRALLDSMVDVL